jgi:hypothetical protein
VAGRLVVITGGSITVRRAVADVIVAVDGLQSSLSTTLYTPADASVTGLIVYTFERVDATITPSLYQSYVPVVMSDVTLIEALPPAQTVWLCGCCEMAAGKQALITVKLPELPGLEKEHDQLGPGISYTRTRYVVDGVAFAGIVQLWEVAYPLTPVAMFVHVAPALLEYWRAYVPP